MSEQTGTDGNKDLRYQFFVLGPGAVGKTALTIRFLSDNFIDEVN